MTSIAEGHKKLERNVTLLGVCALVAVAIGGIVEIAPLFWIDNTIEKVDGIRPYTPLEQAGRDIYIREGCYVCHSQMIRPFRDEVERYGHYSLAAESMFDHPFQWGSKRTGPDLARVGGRYSDAWHVQHLTDPQSVVPESVMPQYGFLAENDLDVPDPAANMTALRRVGVPYSDKDIKMAMADLKAQADPEADAGDLETRYPKSSVRDFDGDPSRITEMDALVAYLQVLGTMVDVNSAAAQEELASEKGAVNPHSTYEALRHLADSYGLAVMLLVFAILALWPFRPGARDRNHEAANMIFKDENDGE